MKFKFTDIENEINNVLNTPKVDSNALLEQISITDTELHEKGVKNHNNAIYKSMVRFLAETKLEVREEGLLYFGDVGTGKTFAMKLICAVRDYNFYNSDDLVLMHIKNSEHFWEIMEENKTIVIDDLDAEPIRVDFGSKYELLGQAIQKRYRMWQKSGTLTLITTNLGGDAIKARYTERLYSRIKQMCECVNAKGENLREKFKQGK